MHFRVSREVICFLKKIVSADTGIQQFFIIPPIGRRYINIDAVYHRPVGFVDLAGHDAPSPSGARVGALAGIARPDAFERTLADAGVTIADRLRLPDHHVYTPADVASISEWIRSAGLDAVVTTEKDAVKLDRLQARWPVPILTLRVEIAMLDGGDKIVGDLIDEVLKDFEDS